MRESYAVRRPILNPYLVRQRDRRRLRELFLLLVTGLVIGVCLLGYVWLHVELLQTGYRVDALEGRLHQAERVERQLRLEAEYLTRPALVERRAIDELGMRAPTLDQVFFEEELR